MSSGIELTKHEQKIVYEALLHHDGHSLMPEWDLKDRRALTLAMDKIRLFVYPGEKPVSNTFHDTSLKWVVPSDTGNKAE